MPSKIKFGTDGWRAIVGENFNLRNVERVAEAISMYLIKSTPKMCTVAVGYDRRRLAKEAANRITQVFSAHNIKVILSDRALPTQAISYVVKFKKLTAGIMVTASHNPPEFNGIKIKESFGGSADIKVTNKIEKLIGVYPTQKISLSLAKKKKLFKKENLVNEYMRFLTSYLDMKLLKKGRVKVLADPMHGVASTFIAEVLKSTPSKVTTIHSRHDFSFGGVKPEPIKSCLRETSSFIKKGDFDIGLATDGDADRIAALDGKGRFINPQLVISLLLLHLIRYRGLRGGVVKTISGTSLLNKISAKYKLPLYETPIGFKHISQLMQKENILIGGEEGGGIGFKNYIPERDGILAGLLLVEMMVAQNKTLADILKDMKEEFGSFVYLRRDITSAVKNKKKVRKKIMLLRKQRTFCAKRIIKIKDYDGVKFYLDDGSWILFRLSGTEPLLRIYAESVSEKRTKELINKGKKALVL